MQTVKMAVPTMDAGDFIRHLDYWREHELSFAISSEVEALKEEHEGRVAAVDRLLGKVRDPMKPLELVAKDSDERLALVVATDRMVAQVAGRVAEVDVDDYEGLKEAAEVVCQWADRSEALDADCNAADIAEGRPVGV